jgi:hypothetical protein
MGTVIAAFNEMVALKCGSAVPEGALPPSGVTNDPTNPLSSIQANVEAAGILLYMNQLVEQYGTIGTQLGSKRGEMLANMMATLAGQLQTLQTNNGSDFSTAIAAAVQTGITVGTSQIWAISNWSNMVNMWTTGDSGACTPFSATEVLNDINSQLSSAGQLALPTSNGDGSSAAFIFGLAMIASQASNSNYFSGAVDGNTASQLYASGAATYLNDLNLLTPLSGSTLPAMTFTDAPDFQTAFDGYVASPSTVFQESTVNNDIEQLLDPAPNPNTPSPLTIGLQNRIEAAGILIYLNQLVAGYGPGGNPPNTAQHIDLDAIFIHLTDRLHALVQGGHLSGTLTTAATEAYSIAQNSEGWDQFPDKWNDRDESGQPLNIPAILQNIQPQLTAAGPLALPPSGNGADAAYMFGLSMINGYLGNTGFFSAIDADGYSAAYLDAAATDAFLQDQEIPTIAVSAAFQSEGNFSYDLQQFPSMNSQFLDSELAQVITIINNQN